MILVLGLTAFSLEAELGIVLKSIELNPNLDHFLTLKREEKLDQFLSLHFFSSSIPMFIKCVNGG